MLMDMIILYPSLSTVICKDTALQIYGCHVVLGRNQ